MEIGQSKLSGRERWKRNFVCFTNAHSEIFRLLPAGMRKTRGIVSRSPTPKEVKAILNPLAGVELRWRIIVINEIPSAPPTLANIPRSPVMVAGRRPWGR
jgi:hypothetical protein